METVNRQGILCCDRINMLGGLRGLPAAAKKACPDSRTGFFARLLIAVGKSHQGQHGHTNGQPENHDDTHVITPFSCVPV